MMADDDLIDKMIGFEMDSVRSNESGIGYGDQGEVRLNHTNEVSELKEIIMSMKIQFDTMSNELNALKTQVASLNEDRPKIRPRTIASMPDPNALRHTNSPIFKRTNTNLSREDDSDSYVSVNKARSEVSSPTTNADANTYMNRQPNAAVFSLANKRIFKNNSATSSRGYDSKMSMWATALTSLLMGAMNRYIQKTGEVSHIINGPFFAKVYVRIVSELYIKVKFTQLPAVQSNELQLLSKVFMRTNKEEIPISSASTWLELSEHTDGASCMAVIESLITAAKMVPEAMIHPISQLVENMMQPVVRRTDAGAIFAIPTTTRISNSPTAIERMCMYMRKDALKTYVSRRLDGESPVKAMMMLTNTMRDTDIFDSKYLSRGRDLTRDMTNTESEF